MDGLFITFITAGALGVIGLIALLIHDHKHKPKRP